MVGGPTGKDWGFYKRGLWLGAGVFLRVQGQKARRGASRRALPPQGRRHDSAQGANRWVSDQPGDWGWGDMRRWADVKKTAVGTVVQRGSKVEGERGC